MTKVRHIRFSSVEQAELVEDDGAEAPLSPTEIEGETLFTLVSAGTELNLYAGNYEKAGQSWGRLPLVPGYAAVFRVERAGAAARGFRSGDLAFCHGKHRSRQRVEARNALAVPEGLPAEHAPFARLMNVTMSTLTTTRARPPAKVLVTGLGPVGLLGALAFRHCGYQVIACEPVAARRAMAEQCGLRNVLAEVPVGAPGLDGEIDLVLECSGHEQAILDGCRIAGQGGEIVVVGVPMVRRTDIHAQEVLLLLFRKYLTLRGGKEQRLPAHATEFERNSMFGNQRAALDWMAAGHIPVEGMYTKASPRAAQEVYQGLLARTSPAFAVLFDWTSL